MPDTRVKICGLTTRETALAAADAGAAYIGLNFFPPSPRFLDVETAKDVAVCLPPGVAKVALTVDASDAVLDEIVMSVPLDFLQLQGSETPERVSELRARFGLPVMKAVGIADASDLKNLDDFEDVADQLLVDAKPTKDATLPGGNGVAFDWRLIASRRWSKPWMLAGGLNPNNVAEAISLTGARQVDVASGVESAPGVKDPELMRAFVSAAG